MAIRLLSLDTRTFYALRNRITGQVHYVGQTLYPLSRLKTHRRGKFRRIAKKCDLWVLREAKRPAANRIEQQVIKAFQRRGECELNGSVGRRVRQWSFHPDKGWFHTFPNRRWARKSPG
jgi:predicted GIY-YIG superfamily endonuclease